MKIVRITRNRLSSFLIFFFDLFPSFLFLVPEVRSSNNIGHITQRVLEG